MANEPAGTWTVLKLLDWTGRYLADAGVEGSRLCAEILLAHALGCERIELYTRFDRQPSPDQLAAFRKLLRRARRHEPTAYLVGWREFYSLRFKVTRDVLVPRPETEQLVDEAVSRFRSAGRGGAMWDICTGSGCVAVAAAVQVPGLTVLATDISPEAVAVATENAEAHGVSGRVRCRTADLTTLPGDCTGTARFDVITANPPYVADADEVGEEVKHEPRIALYAGADGLDAIRRLVARVGAYLAPGGLFAMEFGSGQAAAVRDLLVATGRFAEPRILTDHQGIERTAAAVRA